MQPKVVLDTLRVARVANGILERLRNALREFPVMFAALSEQVPVALKKPKTKADSDAINQEIWAMLIVLQAVCRSFLAVYGQPPERHIGFLHPGEEAQ